MARSTSANDWYPAAIVALVALVDVKPLVTSSRGM